MTNKAILITGPPGVGKTTAIIKVAKALEGRRLAGFFTEEIRDSGRRVGFRAVTIEGQESIIAHVDFPGPHRVGRYGVDVAAVDELSRATLSDRQAADVFLVDEIGKMECFSLEFVRATRRLLETQQPLVATVAQRGGGLIAEVKGRAGVEMVHINQRNRDRVPEQVLWLLRATESGSSGQRRG